MMEFHVFYSFIVLQKKQTTNLLHTVALLGKLHLCKHSGLVPAI